MTPACWPIDSAAILNHWQGHAAQWRRLTSPLRPHQDDVDLFAQALSTHSGRCLLFGVTPELAPLAAPLIAVDNNAGMAHQLWHGDANASPIVLANWLQLPFAPNVFDRAMGDGCLTMLHYPQQYVTLFGQLQRTLRPGARVVLRLFLRPELAETAEAACAAALEGRIGNFHVFKWRLAMALAGDGQQTNIKVASIHDAFQRRLPDRGALCRASGWPLDDIGTIDVYRDSTASYSFPTLPQMRACIPAPFNVTRILILYGRYELAACCPILVMEYCP